MTWAKSQPLWQQVVIADLIQVRDIDEERVSEYVRMVKLEAANKDDLEKEVGEPLDGLDFTSVDEKVEVNITEIEATQNINLIADGSKLTLQKNGLNLIYGNNAAGKSGYTRILKNTCNCRHIEVIRGSTDRPHTDECQAKVSYEINGTIESHEWTEGSEVNAALQTIHVFDEKSSNRFLVKENDIKFMPSGMDVLLSLSSIIERVASKLRDENETLSRGLTRFEPIFAGYESTKAYNLVTNLSAKNAAEVYEELRVLTESESKRKSELEKQIPIKESKSPSAQRRAEATLLSRLKEVQTQADSLTSAIEKENVEKISGLVAQYNAAKVAAEKAKELQFNSDDFLEGTGDEHWKILWRAAKEYSENVVYPEHDHPYIEEGAKCVLCQQPLSPDADERLKNFDAFVSDKSQELATKAKQALDHAIDEFSLSVPAEQFVQRITETISVDDYSAIEEVQTSLLGLSKIHEKYRLKLSAYEEIDSYDEFNEMLEPLKQLVAVNTEIETRHKTPLDDKKYEDELAAERVELSGLSARALLETHSENILSDITAYVASSNIAQASKLATTTASSLEIGVLSNEHVVAQLAKDFNNEISNLFTGKVKAELRRSRTSKGIPYCEIVLVGDNRETKGDGVQLILSEGEQKVVALAGFFAELAQNPANSAIVFDDPVTSLDHANLRRIARRIAEEAKKRQVIVFTHNIVFANELEDAADKLGEDVKFNSKAILKLKNSGVVSDTIDFDNMKVGQRLDTLEKAIGPIRAKHAGGDPTVKTDIINFYRALRVTWERAIEEVLFNRTVVRYRRDIKPASLQDVTIEDTDKSTIADSMEKCAQFVHDLSDEAGAVAIPEPDQLKKDLDELKDFVKSVQTRRKK